MQLKKPDKKKLLKAMTPRQQFAVKNPIADTTIIPDAGYKRLNGNIGSILTFDVAEVSKLEGAPEEIVERAVDGWFAVWHGRVTAMDRKHIPKPLDDWDRIETAKAEGIITRLVSSIGRKEDIEVHNGSDLKSIHVYKWATPAELRMAEHLIGKTFLALKAGSDV